MKEAGSAGRGCIKELSLPLIKTFGYGVVMGIGVCVTGVGVYKCVHGRHTFKVDGGRLLLPLGSLDLILGVQW